MSFLEKLTTHAKTIREKIKTNRLLSKIDISPLQISRRIIQIISLIALNLFFFKELAYVKEFSFLTDNQYYKYFIEELEKALPYVQKYLPELPIVQSIASPYTTIPGLFDVLQLRMTSPDFPFLEIAIIMLTAAIVGRGFCGWVCPFGFLQDILYRIPTPKYKPSYNTNKELAQMKYIFLGFALLLSTWVGIAKWMGNASGLIRALGVFSRAPWAVLDPATTLEAFIPWMFKNNVFAEIEDITDIFSWNMFFWIRMGFLVFVLILSIVIQRGYCRYICPMGALMALFSKYSLITMKINPVRYENIKECENLCPMGVRFPKGGSIRSPECINCGVCASKCPNKAIKPGIL